MDLHPRKNSTCKVENKFVVFLAMCEALKSAQRKRKKQNESQRKQTFSIERKWRVYKLYEQRYLGTHSVFCLFWNNLITRSSVSNWQSQTPLGLPWAEVEISWRCLVMLFRKETSWSWSRSGLTTTIQPSGLLRFLLLRLAKVSKPYGLDGVCLLPLFCFYSIFFVVWRYKFPTNQAAKTPSPKS